MLQTFRKKLGICFVSIFIIVTCASCKADAFITVKEYLNELANLSGISSSKKIDENFDLLLDWNVVVEEDRELLEEKLDYDFLQKSASRLMNVDKEYFIKNIYNIENIEKELVSREDLDNILDCVIDYINNPDVETTYKYEYVKVPKNIDDELNEDDLVVIDDSFYRVNEENELEDVEFDDVFKYLEIADTFEIDLNEAEVIPGSDSENVAYVNNNFNLLSSNHVFETSGFRVSYTLSRTGIDVHVSRNVNGFNFYGDLAVHNIKPTFKWLYEEKDLKNCFFTLTMNTTNKVGVSVGKYNRYYLDFKDLDSSSFLSKLKSIFKKSSDEVDTSIKICTIKTPIASIPSLYLNLDLILKVYISGKMELVLTNSHLFGFESKNGNFRTIYENEDDLEAIIGASSKAALGINLNVEALSFRLMDIELDAGVKAIVKTTLNLYDDDGEVEQISSDVPYSTAQDIAKENEDVRVCGDVSLYWLFDMMFNTSKTVMNKFGLSKTINISDEDNQIFNNLHHIENVQFVENCSRTSRTVIKTMEKVASDKIVLNSYAEVIKVGESFQIEIKNLPEGVTEDDISYSSLDNTIVSINKGLIKALKPGSVKIKIYSKDNKYSAYVNILVSTG